MVNSADPEAALRYWRDAAEAAGWDLATFPLHFPVVVRYILEYIPEAMRDEASKQDSPYSIETRSLRWRTSKPASMPFLRLAA